MRHFDAIRRREPTKTELILGYLLDHPNKVFSPKEVAEGLGFNLQTTVTVLNRLALEGAISKRGRGQFCYGGEEAELQKERVDRAKKRMPPLKMDKKTAALIYNAIYEIAGQSTGADVLSSITGLSPDDFDENAPIESIQTLVRALIGLLGEEIVDDIVSIALENELTREKTLEFRHLLKIRRNRHG